MMEWLAANLGTLLITLLLCAAVAMIVLSLIRDRKKGTCACGGNCGHCPMGGSCRRR